MILKPEESLDIINERTLESIFASKYCLNKKQCIRKRKNQCFSHKQCKLTQKIKKQYKSPKFLFMSKLQYLFYPLQIKKIKKKSARFLKKKIFNIYKKSYLKFALHLVFYNNRIKDYLKLLNKNIKNKKYFLNI